MSEVQGEGDDEDLLINAKEKVKGGIRRTSECGKVDEEGTGNDPSGELVRRGDGRKMLKPLVGREWQVASRTEKDRNKGSSACSPWKGENLQNVHVFFRKVRAKKKTRKVVRE